MNVTQERVMGMVIAILGLLMFLNTLTMSFMMLADDPGPTLLPRIVSVALIFCGVGLIFLKSEGAKKVTFTLNKNSKRMVVSFVALLVYALLFNIIGYIISTFVFLSFLTWHLTENKNKSVIWKSLLNGIVVTVIIYIVFSQLLDVILPAGFL
ncbi:tripartite tricarboxylate transporter TctB family protein [Alkalicoccobacillus plakortidis]|uniref:Tripartite tricarboxylate transporter TctB family protein n=1 Tax=Alkalicoccobacillus plakortidis TaxID=444060 RepID=A0ABT0XJA6_9BACI|nr:tripartite tricarboxylate transporter TctB family protein [Alkalicoccobacillus plakortidis]MCM2675805.1 tripartite tricarboxylate transporter TctB family protein [Alkalicoccobacillus plakortidis]